MPNQIMVNREAVGGSQAARDSSPVDAAATSITSFSDPVIGIFPKLSRCLEGINKRVCVLLEGIT